MGRIATPPSPVSSPVRGRVGYACIRPREGEDGVCSPQTKVWR